MKKYILIVAAFSVLCSKAQEKKALNEFSQLYVSGAAQVEIQKSDELFISADFSKIDFSQDGNSVMVSLKKGSHSQVDKVIIGYHALTQLSAEQASSIRSVDTLLADVINLNVASASDIKVPLKANSIKLVGSSASTAKLSGKVSKLEATLSGASTLKALDLSTEEADIDLSGASDAKVSVSRKLTGNAGGASSLKYNGNPEIKQLNQRGASTIKAYNTTSTTTVSVDGSGTVTTTNGDSTKRYKFSGGRYEFIVHDNDHKDTSKHYGKHRGRHQNWAGIELFENGYLTPDGDVTLPPSQDYMSANYGIRNLGWNLNIFEKDFRFANNHLQVVTGLGFSFNAFNLKNKTTLNPDSSYTNNLSTINAPNISLIKNKLKESFITVPLLLELNTSRKEKRNFHIAAGVIGGLKLGSREKQVFTEDNKTYRDVRKDDFNLFPFKLDATVRVGYGHFTMFATYSLTPLFEYGKGPELYPFSIGLRIIPFDN